jgi:hypothetical protein
MNRSGYSKRRALSASNAIERRTRSLYDRFRCTHKGQAPAKLGRNEFHVEFHRSFVDPAFAVVEDALARVAEVAWQNYVDGRKAPVTVKAGSEAAATEVVRCQQYARHHRQMSLAFFVTTPRR